MKRWTITLLSGAILTLVAADGPKEHLVGQKDKAFSETELKIKVGDKVTFKNDDSVVHNVFSSTEGYEFNTKNQAPGSTATTTFEKEGTLEVRCAIHPKMKMKIVVSK